MIFILFLFIFFFFFMQASEGVDSKEVKKWAAYNVLKKEEVPDRVPIVVKKEVKEVKPKPGAIAPATASATPAPAAAAATKPVIDIVMGATSHSEEKKERVSGDDRKTGSRGGNKGSAPSGSKSSSAPSTKKAAPAPSMDTQNFPSLAQN